MVEYEARGITVRDVAPAVFIEAYALHLKNSDRFEIPKWTDLVKTGVHKELGPTDDDWYFVRAASIARKVYLKPGVGGRRAAEVVRRPVPARRARQDVPARRRRPHPQRAAAARGDEGRREDGVGRPADHAGRPAGPGPHRGPGRAGRQRGRGGARGVKIN